MNSREKDTERLFDQIVILDLPRILSRLRSRHAKRTQKTTGKAKLLIQLNEALNDSSLRRMTSATKTDLRSLKSMAIVLCNLFGRLEAIPDIHTGGLVYELVRDIVKQAHKMTVAASLSGVLQKSQLNPSLKKHLPEAVGKVGRYFSVASELVCAARNKTCQLFHNVRVETFQIAVPLAIYGLEFKVHAEIQLLFFYEIHREALRPRVIASSKSACYLCNLFFDLHGDFHSPRTHGRLYDKWILPDWINVPIGSESRLATIITSFNAALKRQAVKASHSRGEIWDHPNESVLLPLGQWPSSSAVSQHSVSSGNSESTVRPPTPPLTPTDPLDSALAISQGNRDSATRLKHDERASTPAPSIAETITISHEELPHTQDIDFTTPLLHLQVAETLLLFEFVGVISGKLHITQEGPTSYGEGHHVVHAEQVPKASEMQLRCSHDSDELQVQLVTASNKGVCIIFTWGGGVRAKGSGS